MGIPALDRGLDIIDSLLINSTPLKYSDIKKRLADVSDSSLNRLLASLTEKRYIQKNSKNLYILGPELSRWSSILSGKQTMLQKLETAIDNIVSTTNESAAVACYNGEKITILLCKNAHNSISIIPKGETLFYEADHAGSLAIIDNMEPALKSKIVSENSELLNGIDKYKIKADIPYYFDESVNRVGISRLAFPINIEGQPGAIFICAPTVRLKKDLDKMVQELQKQIVLL
ncbi:MAG: helix-turn-helix domain-containing protein [Spirochaetaceae bacterium]